MLWTEALEKVGYDRIKFSNTYEENLLPKLKYLIIWQEDFPAILENLVL